LQLPTAQFMGNTGPVTVTATPSLAGRVHRAVFEELRATAPNVREGRIKDPKDMAARLVRYHEGIHGLSKSLAGMVDTMKNMLLAMQGEDYLELGEHTREAGRAAHLRRELAAADPELVLGYEDTLDRLRGAVADAEEKVGNLSRRRKKTLKEVRIQALNLLAAGGDIRGLLKVDGFRALVDTHVGRLIDEAELAGGIGKTDDSGNRRRGINPATWNANAIALAAGDAAGALARESR
jgi:hypothetical protein